MVNPLDQFGSAVKRGAEAVAGQFTHILPPKSVPAPPDAEWIAATAAKVESDAKRQELADQEAQQRLEQEKAATKRESTLTNAEDVENKTRQLTLKRLTRQDEILDALQKIDPKNPGASDTRDDLLLEFNALSGHPVIERERWPTNPLQIKAAAAVGWSGPLNEMPSGTAEKYEQKLLEFALADKTTTSTSKDQWGDSTSSTRTTHINLGDNKQPSGAPDYPHINGASSSSPTGKNGKSREELLYDEWFKTGNPPSGASAMNHVREWIAQNGKKDPAIVTPADRRALIGVDTLADALESLNPYNHVLENGTERGLLEKIIRQTYTPARPSLGVFSGIESLIAIGVDQELLNQLKRYPDGQKFLDRFIRAKESIVSLRPFQGNMRMTGPAYDAMVAQLPDPRFTVSEEQANDKSKQLEMTIDRIRKSMGNGAPEESAPGNPPNTKKADPRGFVPD